MGCISQACVVLFRGPRNKMKMSLRPVGVYILLKLPPIGTRKRTPFPNPVRALGFRVWDLGFRIIV